MRDRVAEVLTQRQALHSGAGIGVALSLVLHAGLAALAAYAALHQAPVQPAKIVQIQFTGFPHAPVTSPAKPAQAKKPEPPKIVPPRPEPPKPVTTTTPPEKNTVPLSPFGRSEKKGSENPLVPPKPQPTTNHQPTTATTGTDAVPIGGIGSLEGANFPYTIYIENMQRRIGANWARPQSVAAGAATIILFRIERDGSISDAKVDTSSGNATFDRAALSAVRISTPLAPLPFGYNGTYLLWRMIFR